MKQGSLVTSTLIFGILAISTVNAAQNYSYTINSIENQANYNHGIMYSGVEEYENFDESYGYEMNDIDAKLTVRSIGLKLKRNAKINKKVYFIPVFNQNQVKGAFILCLLLLIFIPILPFPEIAIPLWNI